MHRRLVPTAVLTLCAWAAATPALRAATTVAGASSAAELIDKLGLRVADQPVRERPGWRTPRVVLITKEAVPLLPALQQAAPRARLIEVSAATPKEVAAADATIGVCSAEVLAQAKQLQWIQWLAVGVDRCVQQPALRERHVLLTNLQRTMGPSMAEHVLAMMLALSRHLDQFGARRRLLERRQQIRDLLVDEHDTRGSPARALAHRLRGHVQS